MTRVTHTGFGTWLHVAELTRTFLWTHIFIVYMFVTCYKNSASLKCSPDLCRHWSWHGTWCTEFWRFKSPCSDAIGYQRFGGSCCIHLQGYFVSIIAFFFLEFPGYSFRFPNVYCMHYLLAAARYLIHYLETHSHHARGIFPATVTFDFFVLKLTRLSQCPR
jgi:hypothetical protein